MNGRSALRSGPLPGSAAGDGADRGEMRLIHFVREITRLKEIQQVRMPP